MWRNPWGQQELLPHHLYKEGWRSVPKWWNWEAWWYDLRQVRHLRDQLTRVLGCVYLQGLISMLPISYVTKMCCFTFDVLLHCCDSCAVHIPQTCSWYQKGAGARSHVLFVSFPDLTSTIAAVFFDHYHCWGQAFTLLKCLLCIYKIHKLSCLHPSETRLALTITIVLPHSALSLVSWETGVKEQAFSFDSWIMEYVVYVQILQYAWYLRESVSFGASATVTRRKHYASARGDNTENRNRLRLDLII